MNVTQKEGANSSVFESVKKYVGADECKGKAVPQGRGLVEHKLSPHINVPHGLPWARCRLTTNSEDEAISRTQAKWKNCKTPQPWWMLLHPFTVCNRAWVYFRVASSPPCLVLGVPHMFLWLPRQVRYPQPSLKPGSIWLVTSLPCWRGVVYIWVRFTCPVLWRRQLLRWVQLI